MAKLLARQGLIKAQDSSQRQGKPRDPFLSHPSISMAKTVSTITLNILFNMGFGV